MKNQNENPVDVILGKARELGFEFNESDAHDMWIEIKKLQSKDAVPTDFWRQHIFNDGYENGRTDTMIGLAAVVFVLLGLSAIANYFL